MKFAKRLDAEAARCWKSSYFNYKAVKHSIKQESKGAGALLPQRPFPLCLLLGEKSLEGADPAACLCQQFADALSIRVARNK